MVFSRGNRVLAQHHRYYVAAIAALALGLLITYVAPLLTGVDRSPSKDPIKVGVLHSLSGTMAVSERTVADATLFAIDQLNQNGGVLGRRVEPIVIDGRSDWALFAKKAEELIVQDKVSAVFGCWTSACRKTVKPVFERDKGVLFYPVQYEGLERSPNIIYTGAAPNQQIIPATKWSIDNLGRRIYLVGSDYVFPRTANAIIRIQVGALKGKIVGEGYVPLGGRDFSAIIEEIKKIHPDVIFNTINGDSNIAFYHQLRAAGIRSDDIPVMSFSLAEAEVQAIGPDLVAGDYASRNYFQSVDSPENKAFVKAFRAAYGQSYVTTAPMEAAYFGVQLWARAVEEAGSADYADYRAFLMGQSMRAPSGIVYIDPASQHTWRTVLIGRMTTAGDFSIVWSSGRPIRPEPFPGFLTEPEWLVFLDGLYKGWNNHWAAPSRSGS
ncbi:urea ABC transporter substrate-binding protein [Rhodospirillum sp. A1_3_36]|uniref:urea ABC transporter substrate-binding protein n=1 Tax=Rhodospirillum sp. A1_3_36 TaxID=3391666 RepID=UPI0039A4E5A7